MATTLTIGRITGIQHIDTSANGDSITISGAVQESTTALTLSKAKQLREMLNNRDYLWHYIAWPTSAGNELDGFYEVESFNMPIDRECLSRYRFDLQLRKLGDLSSHAVATQWDNAAIETIAAVWSALTPYKMVSVPYLATNIDWTVAGTLVTASGSNQILRDPTRQTITYNSSATLANWFASECQVYDSVVAGDAVEANWVQVFDKRHVFAGDVILQNGLLRYKLNSVTGTFYVYDSVTNPNAWVDIGTFLTYLTGSVLATVAELSIVRLNADVIEWRERRHYSDDEIQILYTLRRGARYCRMELTTTSAAIDSGGIQLFKLNQYANLFNSTVSRAAGSGDLAQDASHCYECGYRITANVISGFALCDQPAKQPYDGFGDYLFVSLTWTTSQTRVFSIIGWSQTTSTLGNLVLNPGFETLGGGGADVFANWTEMVVDGTIVSVDTVHAGTKAVQITAGVSLGDYVAQAFTVIPARVMSLQFWTRGDGTYAGRYVVWDTTHGAAIIAATSTGVTGTTYTLVSADFATPAGCTEILVMLYCPATNAGIAYFDDVALFDLWAARDNADVTSRYSLYSLEQRTTIKPKALVMSS